MALLRYNRLSGFLIRFSDQIRSDQTGFGCEVKVHLEILICYLDGDIGFFLRRMCQSDPRVEEEEDAVRLVEASFTANNKKRVVLTEVASLGALCI